MSEEAENNGGFFSNLKNQVITGAGVALTTIGGVFFDEVKGMLGIADEEEGGAKTEMVQEQKQETNVSVSGPEIIINIPEQKTETKTIIKEVPAKPVEKPKEKEQEIDW
jgi:hypothetical protein